MVTVLKAPVIPNTFSPNNDGINDTWRIQHLESYPGALVQVYDRYGKQVFTSIGYGRDWDGKFLGTPFPIGTYYYIVDPKNGRKLISGSITILR
jgi:gliding motility-associated-like protein